MYLSAATNRQRAIQDVGPLPDADFLARVVFSDGQDRGLAMKGALQFLQQKALGRTAASILVLGFACARLIGLERLPRVALERGALSDYADAAGKHLGIAEDHSTTACGTVRIPAHHHGSRRWRERQFAGKRDRESNPAGCDLLDAGLRGWYFCLLLLHYGHQSIHLHGFRNTHG